MRTLVDLGPAATAERDFHETANDVLAKSMLALEAVQGALLTFDPSGTRMTSVASVKMEAVGPEVSIIIARQQSQRWAQTRQPVIVKGNEVEEDFGAQHMAGLQSLRMFAPLRAGSGVVGALLLGERLNQARYSEFESEAVGIL